MTPRLASAVLASVFLTSCLHGAPGGSSRRTVARTPAEQTRLRGTISEIRTLLRAQDEEVWKHWVEGGPLELNKSYLGHEALFTPASIEEVERLRRTAVEASEVRALTHLKMYLVGEYLSRALAEQNDAIANLEASMTFSLDGRDQPYRELPRLLATERNAPRRRALYAAATPAVERLSQSVRRKNEKIEQVLKTLGYSDYAAYGAELRQVDLVSLRSMAEEVLQATRASYLKALEPLCKSELSLPFSELRLADLPRLFRASGVERPFPKAALLARAQATLSGLGIDLGTMNNLKLDLREQTRKNPRPLSLAVEIPTDLRVSLRPLGGSRDQGDLFHELGHSLHYAFTTEPSFELSKLGNITVSEAYAFLLEDLVDDPAWLQQYTDLRDEPLARYLASSGVHKLFLLRRAAGNLLYGLAQHRREDSGGEDRALFKELRARTYLLAPDEHETARYLVEGEDFYQGADDFRAWVLAAELQAQLKGRFGERWWTQAAAGDFLKKLWAHGNALSAEEVAREAGSRELRADALVKRLSQRVELAPPAPGNWIPRTWGKPQQPEGQESETADGPAPRP